MLALFAFQDQDCAAGRGRRRGPTPGCSAAGRRAAGRRDGCRPCPRPLRLKLGLVGVGPLLVGQRPVERERVEAVLQLHFAQLRPICVDLALGDLLEGQLADDAVAVVAADQDADRHLRALLDQRRRLDALDQHFLLVALPGGQRHHVDLHVQRPGQSRLLLGVAEVLVAVADEDDALAGALGERGEGQLEGGGDVGVVAVACGRQLGELEARRVAGRQFQARLPPKTIRPARSRAWPAPRSSTASLMNRRMRSARRSTRPLAPASSP